MSIPICWAMRAPAWRKHAHVAANAGVAGRDSRPLINLGGDTWALFPWLGSYAFLALERLLKIKCADELGLKGLDPSRPYFMQFRMKADEETFYRVVAAEAEPISPPSIWSTPARYRTLTSMTRCCPQNWFAKASRKACST